MFSDDFTSMSTLRAIYHAKHIEYTSHFCKMLKLELKIMMKNCALYICQCCHYLQEFLKKKTSLLKVHRDLSLVGHVIT